jgi:hypothetical protein
MYVANRYPQPFSFSTYLKCAQHPWLAFTARSRGTSDLNSLGWARTIYLYVYTVCVRYFKQENHHTYSYIRCVYTLLANPMNNHLHINQHIPFHIPLMYMAPSRLAWRVNARGPSVSTSACRHAMMSLLTLHEHVCMCAYVRVCACVYVCVCGCLLSVQKLKCLQPAHLVFTCACYVCNLNTRLVEHMQHVSAPPTPAHTHKSTHQTALALLRLPGISLDRSGGGDPLGCTLASCWSSTNHASTSPPATSAVGTSPPVRAFSAGQEELCKAHKNTGMCMYLC